MAEVRVGFVSRGDPESVKMVRNLVERFRSRAEIFVELVRRAVPAEELESAVNELATTLAEKSPIAMRIGKTLLNRALQTDLKAAQELEIALCMLNTATEDYEEGM